MRCIAADAVHLDAAPSRKYRTIRFAPMGLNNRAFNQYPIPGTAINLSAI
jgi:hypothetical protein